MNRLPAQRRNSQKRLWGWVSFYLAGLIAFVIFVGIQGQNIPTYAFYGGQIQLATDKTSYIVGDVVSYTITNGLDTSITLANNCPSEPLHVYQWLNGQWARIHDTQDSVSCGERPEPITVAAHSAVTKSYADWPKLFAKPGIYRIVAMATNYTGLPYADFLVTSFGQPALQPQIIYQPIYIPVPGGRDRGDD